MMEYEKAMENLKARLEEAFPGKFKVVEGNEDNWMMNGRLEHIDHPGITVEAATKGHGYYRSYTFVEVNWRLDWFSRDYTKQRERWSTPMNPDGSFNTDAVMKRIAMGTKVKAEVAAAKKADETARQAARNTEVNSLKSLIEAAKAIPGFRDADPCGGAKVDLLFTNGVTVTVKASGSQAEVYEVDEIQVPNKYDLGPNSIMILLKSLAAIEKL